MMIIVPDFHLRAGLLAWVLSKSFTNLFTKFTAQISAHKPISPTQGPPITLSLPDLTHQLDSSLQRKQVVQSAQYSPHDPLSRLWQGFLGYFSLNKPLFAALTPPKLDRALSKCDPFLIQSHDWGLIWMQHQSTRLPLAQERR